jgi:membrane-bound lytic murein transglycosylase A
LLAGILCGCAVRPVPPPLLRMTQVRFAALQGWAENDPRAGLSAFLRSCGAFATGQSLRGAGYAGSVADWQPICARANELAQAGVADIRRFFEAEFMPYRVVDAGDGLFTGYYEPEVSGSRTRHDVFQTPLYGVPSDLATATPYAARAEIVRDGLVNAEPLVYLDDPVDAFFLQVQGSGRVVLDDGSVMRLAYAGQNGQPYTPIGAVLIEMGELTRENVSAQSIRAWLMAHPDRTEELLDKNASYIFFSLQPLGDPALGANGTEGVPLTPGASIAIDGSLHPLGVPLWLETAAPDADASKPAQEFDRLMVAQDTGGAIKGSLRGDIYWGFGGEAGAIAGRMRSTGRMAVLLPKALAARLGARAVFTGPRS